MYSGRRRSDPRTTTDRAYGCSFSDAHLWLLRPLGAEPVLAHVYSLRQACTGPPLPVPCIQHHPSFKRLHTRLSKWQAACSKRVYLWIKSAAQPT
jgi:hypothetical protein